MLNYKKTYFDAIATQQASIVQALVTTSIERSSDQLNGFNTSLFTSRSSSASLKSRSRPRPGAAVAIPPTAIFSNLSFSSLEGDTGSFQLALDQAPASEIKLTFTASNFLVVDADGDISNGTQDSITFTPTNWSQPRTVWFIAEVDDSGSDRISGNTIPYTLSGGLVANSGTYELGTIQNTHTPDPTQFNIDLDFRNDILGLWTATRRAIAQQAANDWAKFIANEWDDFQLNHAIVKLDGTTTPASFTTRRLVEDVLIFVNPLNGSEAAGLGSPEYSFGGWVTSPTAMPRVGQIAINLQALTPTSPNQALEDAYLYSAITHEIGHVLGLLGFNWQGYSLLDGPTPQTAVFRGEYARLANGGEYIPLQAQDGPNPVTGQYDYYHPAGRVNSIMSYEQMYQLSAPTAIDYALLADSGYRIRGINA